VAIHRALAVTMAWTSAGWPSIGIDRLGGLVHEYLEVA
jgi:hypothetical protein